MSALLSPSKSPTTVPPVTASRPVALGVWPSGLVIPMLIGPVVAAVVFMSTMMCVGSVTVFELTVTPPVKLMFKWFGNAAPGSKKPEPADDVPLMMRTTLGAFGTDGTDTDAGVAGGGATNFVARTDHTLVALEYSWKVQTLMSSLGS